jgi:ABC-type multidrug transport system ATPase subunit
MSLTLNSVSKQYGDRWAVRDVSLELESGMVGLVGPNGAGKTTLMRMVATLLPATAGTIRWSGIDVREEGARIRRVLGYLPQDFGVYPELSARSFLRYMAAMKRLPEEDAKRRVDELLELVNLKEDADRKLRTYSGGMKQRVGIAQALLNDPELLIVDEPTAGLDPEERVRFRNLLAGLTSNRLIILSTHIIGDVEAVASRLVVIRGGRILVDTSPEQLIAAATGKVWSITTDAQTATRLQVTYPVSAMVSHANSMTIRVVSATSPISSAVAVEPNLEDAYLLAVQTDSAAAA